MIPADGGGAAAVDLSAGGPGVPTRLGTSWATSSTCDRLCYALAAALFASGVAHLGVQAVAGGPWEGPVSWHKPVTFGPAFGLTLGTLTWVTGYLPMRERLRDRLLAVFAVACAAEVAVITVQAWRLPSHFNVSTPLDATLAYTAAAGGAVLIASTVAFAAATLRPHPAVPASMRLAVRVGFLTFLAALAIGAAMIGIGVWTGRTVSQDAAYTAAAALKAGHGATMHGILVLPALAWSASFTGWTEARRVQVVALACVGYLLAAGVVAVESVIGIDPLALQRAPLLGVVSAYAGVLCVLTATGMVLVGIARRADLVSPR